MCLLFENEHAAGWLENLLERQEISLLYEAFDLVIGENVPERLGVRECHTAVVAAEILLQLVERDSVSPLIDPGKVEKLATFLTYDQCKLRMINLALRCTDKILFNVDNLMFRQLLNLEESELNLWISAVENLSCRLRKAKQSLAR